MLALRTYGLCLLIRTGTRIATGLILRTRTLSDMVALDKRLYTSHPAPTDSVSRLSPLTSRVMCPACLASHITSPETRTLDSTS
jgi:hypothetical protein